MDPIGSFTEAIEHAKDAFDQAKQDADRQVMNAGVPIQKNPSDTQEIVPPYSVWVGVWKTSLPVVSGAATVTAIALLDFMLDTDYLTGKISPIVVVGVTAAARFIQNYLKQARKAQGQKE